MAPILSDGEVQRRRRERAYMDQAIIRQLRRWGEHQVANLQQMYADDRTDLGPWQAYQEFHNDPAHLQTVSVKVVAAELLHHTLSLADEYGLAEHSEEPPEDWAE